MSGRAGGGRGWADARDLVNVSALLARAQREAVEMSNEVERAKPYEARTWSGVLGRGAAAALRELETILDRPERDIASVERLWSTCE